MYRGRVRHGCSLSTVLLNIHDVVRCGCSLGVVSGDIQEGYGHECSLSGVGVV